MTEDDEFYDSESEPSFIESPEKTDSTEKIPPTSDVVIYAVQFINGSKDDQSFDQTASNGIRSRIFISHQNAMKLCKQDPDNRRFKAFKKFQEAYEFSYGLNVNERAPTLEQVQSSLHLTDGSVAGNSSNSTKRQQNNLATDAEKLPFSAPKKPEINELRRFIEKNDLEKVRNRILENPRFLISSGDSPVIYQLSFFKFNIILIFRQIKNSLNIKYL